MNTSAHQNPFRILHPTFIKNIAIAETALYSFLGIFTVTMGAGIVITLLFLILGLSKFLPLWLPFFAIFVATLIFIQPYVYKLLKQNHEDTYYKFYPDHMTFQQYQMLLFKKRGRLRYMDINDIIERTDIIQSRYNIGTVWVLAPGTGITAGQRFPGLKMSHIHLTEELSDFFEDILSRGSESLSGNIRPEETAAAEADETLFNDPTHLDDNVDTPS